MPTSTGAKLWIPSGELQVVSQEVPLVSITEIAGKRLHTALLESPGYLSKLAKTRVLVRTGHWTSDDHKVEGAFGYITPKQAHPLYPRGLMFTTYTWIDVKYHLHAHTVTERSGIERIEVPEPDRGLDLGQFVLDCYKRYSVLGLKATEREERLLFYQPT